MFLKTYTRYLPLLRTKSAFSHTFHYSGPQRKLLSKLNERSGDKTSPIYLNSTAKPFRYIALAFHLVPSTDR